MDCKGNCLHCEEKCNTKSNTNQHGNCELKDDEIIKALPMVAYAGHYCNKCKYKIEKGDFRCGLKGCRITRDALDLINRQKTEIERLQNILKNGCELSRCINKGWLQSEAIKEFAEKVYRFFCKIQNWKKFKSAVLFNGECDWLKEKFDNLVKEMTEFKE